MNQEIPGVSPEQESEKTAKQIVEDLIGISAEDFIREVIESMQRFKDKKNFIVREAIHALPKGQKTDQNLKTIMDALPDLVDEYLENN
jgi:hypothetical protein